MPSPQTGLVVVDTVEVAPPLVISSDSRLSSLLKEAKAYRQKFHAILEGSDVRPNASNVEFARKELRNVYLKLLFHFTFSGRTRLTEHSIWFETTHPIVHLYRSQLSSIESKLRKQEHQHVDGGGANDDVNTKRRSAAQPPSHLAQNHAKLASAFRAFLSSEELFWRDVAGHITMVYDATEIVPHLRSLDIVTESGHLANAGVTGVGRIVGLETLSADAKAEAALPSSVDRLTEIVHKALLYCGDIARYTEQYRDERQDDNEESIRKHGDRNPSSRGRGRGRGGSRTGRGGIFSYTTQVRDFSRAAAFYEQARHLLPSNGNPWNQLAVLAIHRGDTFNFVYDCYRALCVSEPFEKAKTNMERTLRKSLEKWIEEGNLVRFADDIAEDERRQSRTSSTVLLLDLSILHAAYLQHNSEVLQSRFPEACLDEIRALLRRKALPTDVVVRMTLTTIAALWLHRLWRGTAAVKKLSGAASSIVVEHSILHHLCGMAQAMLDIGANEVVEAMASDETEHDAPQQSDWRPKDERISPTLRRMLPALRLLSKWIKAHIGYVQKSRQQSQAQSFSSEDPESSASASSLRAFEQMAIGVDHLWSSYANFVNVIRYAFPFESLPTLGTSVGQSGMSGIDFEEDRDIRGFIPMRKSTMIEVKNIDLAPPPPVIRPQDEHLIRIADIMIDAKVVAETQSSPIQFIDEKNSFEYLRNGDNQGQTSTIGNQLKASRQSLASGGEDDANDASESSEDAVDLAMRAVDERRRALAEGYVNGQSGDASLQLGDLEVRDGNSVDDEDDDEIILVPSTRSRSDVQTAPTAMQPTLRRAQDDTSVAQPELLNAQHLLLQVINGSPRSANTAAQLTASNTSSPKPLGPIGSPINRDTPSPQFSNPTSAAWPTESHRSDIWAPPSTSHMTGLANQSSTAFGALPSVGWSNIPAQPSNLRDWPRSTSKDNPW